MYSIPALYDLPTLLLWSCYDKATMTTFKRLQKIIWSWLIGTTVDFCFGEWMQTAVSHCQIVSPKFPSRKGKP